MAHVNAAKRSAHQPTTCRVGWKSVTELVFMRLRDACDQESDAKSSLVGQFFMTAVKDERPFFFLHSL